MLQLTGQIDEATAAIRRHWNGSPRVGIILGTGLGHFTQEIVTESVLCYEHIPHFPRATALAHAGQFVCGRVAGVPVITMEGRFHLYEGYPLEQITLPVRVMKAMGISLLIVSNASGGLNPNYRAGDIVVLDDHINLMADNPLIGINDEGLGPRFPDMSRPYDRDLADQALGAARRENIVAHRGVYAALCGPCYETRAEYRFLRMIGADVVGMSTVPEVLVAAHAGLKVLALSAVTNVCRPDALGRVDGHSVVEAAQSAEPSMRKIVRQVLLDFAERPATRLPAPQTRCSRRRAGQRAPLT